jgi:hypothetical protein
MLTQSACKARSQNLKTAKDLVQKQYLHQPAEIYSGCLYFMGALAMPRWKRILG